jgi:hypothetical protein
MKATDRSDGRWRYEPALLGVTSIGVFVFSLLALIDGETPFGLSLLAVALLSGVTVFTRVEHSRSGILPLLWIVGGIILVIAGVLSLLDGFTALAILTLAGGGIISLTMLAFVVLRYLISTKTGSGLPPGPTG